MRRLPERRSRRGCATAAVVLFGLVGCATPDSVRNLTAETGDASIELAAQLRSLQKTQASIADARARAIARVAGAAAADANELDQLIALRKAVGLRAEPDAYEALRKLSDDLASKQKVASGRADGEYGAIKKGQQNVAVPAKELEGLAAELLKLADDGSGFDRLKFIGGFLRSVFEDVSKAAQDGEASGDKAKAEAASAADKAKSETAKGERLDAVEPVAPAAPAG